MKKSNKIKSAYALLNILIENDKNIFRVNFEFIPFAIKRIYSLYLVTDEIREVMKFINEEFIIGDVGVLTNEAKKQFLKENDDWADSAPILEVQSLNSGLSIEYYETGILKAILSDLKSFIKDEIFTNKYRPSVEIIKLKKYRESDEYYYSDESSFIDEFDELQKLNICTGIVRRIVQDHTDMQFNDEAEVGEEDNYSNIIANEVIQAIRDEYSIRLRKDQFQLAISYFGKKYSLCWNEFEVDLDNKGHLELAYYFPVDTDRLFSIWDDLEIKRSNLNNVVEEEEEDEGYYRNQNIDHSFFGPENNEDDIMKIKKDIWGNPYTVGGKMWEDYNNNYGRSNDDD